MMTSRPGIPALALLSFLMLLSPVSAQDPALPRPGSRPAAGPPVNPTAGPERGPRPGPVAGPARPRQAASAAYLSWKKAHLHQQAAVLDARIASLKVSRLSRQKDAEKNLEKARRITGRALARLTHWRRKAARAFVDAGKAIDAALAMKPLDFELHAWRAELFATMADSGRPIGEVLGPMPRGMLALSGFTRGLQSARLAHEAKPKDPFRSFLLARLLAVFNRGKESIPLLRSITKPASALPRDRIFLANLLFESNQFGAADKILAPLLADPSAPSEAKRLTRLIDIAARTWSLELALRKKEAIRGDLPRVILSLPAGQVELELFEDSAPNTVANFIALVASGFYDGTAFHRLESNFLVQGGDPNTRPGAKGPPGSGGPGWAIADEGRERGRAHFRGSLAMARGAKPDSAGSQFYISLAPAPELDGKGTVFGRVVAGMDAVAKLRAGAQITKARMLRKRKHLYLPKKLPLPKKD